MTDYNIPDPEDQQNFDDRDGHLTEQWYSTPDTEIGGWVVTNSPKPYHEQDYREGEVAVANFLSEELAKHIVELHSKWLTYCHEEINYHAPMMHRNCILR